MVKVSSEYCTMQSSLTVSRTLRNTSLATQQILARTLVLLSALQAQKISGNRSRMLVSVHIARRTGQKLICYLVAAGAKTLVPEELFPIAKP